MALPVPERGALCGLPVAIKDLTEVAGVRTTYGSPIYKDFVPENSDPLVERLEAEGGVVYAKSNTPEFGAGANTFNEVFGATRNPCDTRLSAAGSSGGAAVALKTGMAWLAHGSDLGGSLRNPASFNGIVGLRPSWGRVATDPGQEITGRLSVEGPMARTVEDVALFLDVLSGEDVRDPMSLPRPATPFLTQARSGWRPARVAWSADLGITPVDPEVAEITRRAALRFGELGAIVEEAHPDLSEAHEAFQVLRARSFAISKKELLDTRADLLKPEVIWNIEQGLKLTCADILRAEHQRAAMYRRMLSFFGTHDLICTPATIVAAYPVENRYVAECNGVTFGNYVEWLAIAYAFTLCGCPAISLPAGYTRDGRPIGLQIVARPRDEGRLLAAAMALEQVLALNTGLAVDPQVRHR
jgi:amidase